MGNTSSSPDASGKRKEAFPGASLLDSAGYLCGSVDDATDGGDTTTAGGTTAEALSMTSNLLARADAMCISSPKKETPVKQQAADEVIMNPTSALFARALVSEVTDNPRTMTPAAMAERERRLLKAQEAARKPGAKPVGTMGQPNLLGSLAEALSGNKDDSEHNNRPMTTKPSTSVVPPNSLLENRAQQTNRTPPRPITKVGKHSVTIGLSLSRRHSSLGHPDTVTRQTAFDFNDLQDRQYKYVSSTDSSGWMAGGGERGGNVGGMANDADFPAPSGVTSMLTPQGHHKFAAPDTVHIPIIQIDAESPAAINVIVSALARGEVFIPHMSILPEALSVNGISPPDLVVRFGCERNDDIPPDEWPNWCLEFMHNQLYEYFATMGAQWSVRPFQITLARKVRWKTVKHMNRYFAHAERVIDAWREKGPQYLDPQLSYIEGGATPEEVARPHGIYLLRNGVPTNYFAPNFDPPYTTKMTRSLLLNVLAKSWDKKRREWTSEPVPRLVTPSVLVATMCGCTDPGQGGFMANEVTNTSIGATSTTATTNVTTQEQKSTTVEAAISHESVEQAMSQDSSQDDDIEEVHIQQSASGGSMSKMSSVLLTPYDNDDTKEKMDPFGALGPLEDDLNDDLDDDGYISEEEPQEPLPVESPASLSMKDSSDDDLDWDVDFRAQEHPTIANSHTKQVGGRYGTPESMAVRTRTNRSMESMSPTDTTTAPSDFNESTATVPHQNITRFAEREFERKAREEKKDEAYLEEDSFGAIPKSSSTGSKKKKKSRNKVKEAYEMERARQIAMIALAQEETNKVKLHNAGSSTKKKELALFTTNENSPKYTMQSQPTTKAATPEVSRNDSGSVSLDYSIDSSLIGDASTLAGQYIAGDASVSTNASKRKKFSEDESVQESETSNPEVVPTDEELFAVGWAKALDPKSGSFYYFTLDRSKIVWDNPLDDSHTEASSSVPPAQQTARI